MGKPIQVVSLEDFDGKRFMDFLDGDRVLHIFTIYDLQYLKEKTRVWVALRDDGISAYLFEFDERIVHAHGASESIRELLSYVNLDEPVLIIEPSHLTEVEKQLKPVEPTDRSSKGRITKYFVLKADASTFQPKIRHHVKKLGTEDLDQVSQSLGDEYKRRAEDAVSRGLAYGAFENGSLVSVATVPEIIGDIAFVRGVFTGPSVRGRGLATSACSALVEEVIRLGKEAVLWVAEDNLPARRVYERIGFKETGHVLLGFKAKRLKTARC